MAEVTKLSIVNTTPIPNIKEQLLEKFDNDMKKMREWLVETSAGGYALVAYDMQTEEQKPKLHSWTNLFLHNPGDSFWLPDMVKTRVHQRIHEK